MDTDEIIYYSISSISNGYRTYLPLQNDVIIGSIHYVGKLYTHPGLPDLRDAKDFYQEYWRDMLKTVANGGFDVLAHIDNPKRAYGYFTYEEKMLKNIARDM